MRQHRLRQSIRKSGVRSPVRSCCARAVAPPAPRWRESPQVSGEIVWCLGRLLPLTDHRQWYCPDSDRSPPQVGSGPACRPGTGTAAPRRTRRCQRSTSYQVPLRTEQRFGDEGRSLASEALQRVEPAARKAERSNEVGVRKHRLPAANDQHTLRFNNVALLGKREERRAAWQSIRDAPMQIAPGHAHMVF